MPEKYYATDQHGNRVGEIATDDASNSLGCLLILSVIFPLAVLYCAYKIAKTKGQTHWVYFIPACIGVIVFIGALISNFDNHGGQTAGTVLLGGFIFLILPAIIGYSQANRT